MRTKALVSVLAFVAGCGYSGNTRFGYDPPPGFTAPKSDLVIAVEPFTDTRGPRKYPGLLGRGFLTYIPLIPYIKVPYERLDESYAITQKKAGLEPGPEDHFPYMVTEAVAQDLLKSGLAKTFILEEGAASPPAHLLLKGDLGSTKFDTYMTSYMLGIAGVLLWLLPIPIGGTTARIDLDLSLHEPMGPELWSCQAKGDSTHITTLYNSENVASTSSKYRVTIHHFGSNSHGIDPDSLWAYHADALRKGMEPCRESLAEFLESYEPQTAVLLTEPASSDAAQKRAEDKLRRLKRMLEEGLISPEDYEREKRDVLEGL